MCIETVGELKQMLKELNLADDAPIIMTRESLREAPYSVPVRPLYIYTGVIDSKYNQYERRLEACYSADGKYGLMVLG